MASPAKRQASVSIEEPQASSEPKSPVAIPAAAAKQSPKEVAKQLLASIPAKEMEIFAKWKVKQVNPLKRSTGLDSVHQHSNSLCTHPLCSLQVVITKLDS